MDLAETMKSALSKVSNNQPGGISQHGSSKDSGGSGIGYVTEKLYLLLQLYIQNKGWNPSVEILQCFSELKDNALLPSAAYLQVIANRLALDSQGRLVLRESGKIVLPYEHFANAVMLKHMSGPHGMHLNLNETMRAVMESYSIGRESFGMEKEFIIEVVQSCPSASCRYYKTHMGVPTPPTPPFLDQSQFQQPQLNPEFLGHMQQMANDFTSNAQSSSPHQLKHIKSQHIQQAQQQAQQQAAANQQITAAIIQQQNRAIAAQQSLEKFGNLSPMEKQRVLQQFDKKHFEAVQAANLMSQTSNLGMNQPQEDKPLRNFKKRNVASSPSAIDNKFIGMVPQSSGSLSGVVGPGAGSIGNSSALLNTNNMGNGSLNVLRDGGGMIGSIGSAGNTSVGGLSNITGINAGQLCNSNNQAILSLQQQSQPQHIASPSPQLQPPPMESPTNKSNDYMRGSLECLESLSASNKDLLALHNGAWGNQDSRNEPAVGQDKIVRAFTELMKNMARMKTFIRPSMCKPYGKQSESLQKTLMDTIQLVQTLRNCLPAPHIQVNSWKSEDRLRKDPETPTVVDY